MHARKYSESCLDVKSCSLPLLQGLQQRLLVASTGEHLRCDHARSSVTGCDAACAGVHAAWWEGGGGRRLLQCTHRCTLLCELYNDVPPNAPCAAGDQRRFAAQTKACYQMVCYVGVRWRHPEHLAIAVTGCVDAATTPGTTPMGYLLGIDSLSYWSHVPSSSRNGCKPEFGVPTGVSLANRFLLSTHCSKQIRPVRGRGTRTGLTQLRGAFETWAVRFAPPPTYRNSGSIVKQRDHIRRVQRNRAVRKQTAGRACSCTEGSGDSNLTASAIPRQLLPSSPGPLSGSDLTGHRKLAAD